MDYPTGTVLLDPSFGTTVVNATDVATEDVWRALGDDNQRLLRTFEDWAVDARSGSLKAYAEGPSGPTGPDRRAGNLWHRDRYVTPSKFFDQMRLARAAMHEDDIVAGVAETTESLAFSSMSFFAEDAEEEDVYNQIARKLDLDARFREIWRELFAVSQVYVAVTKSRQSFKVRGRTPEGNLRRKTFDLIAPKRITLLDPTKVVPVGSPYAAAFTGNEMFAYIADRGEGMRFGSIVDGDQRDEVVEELVVGRYTPDLNEGSELAELGVDTGSLWLLDPTKVFRHSLTVPGYRRVADVRLKSVFELLDMKHQLRQMERAHLIGGTNFIVLITQGSDQHPARQDEIQHLQAQVRTAARVPILVGDHRLHVEIVTPKLDNVLRAERWNTIDSRITARLYGMFMLGNYAAGASGDDSTKLVKVIARGMESRRHMIVRSLERNIFAPLFDGNEILKSPPKLQFHPRSIALDFDAAYASFLFDLREANELSRETILNQFDLDQDLEAEYRKREEEEYDDIFKTQVPFSTPNPANPQDPSTAPQPAAPGTPAPAPKAPTRRDNGGGTRNGGGAAPGSGQGETPRRRPKRGTPSKARLTIDVDGVEGISRQQLVSALREALAPGDDEDANGTDEA